MQIGDQFSFVPEGFCGEETKSPHPGRKEAPRKVTGTVIYINRPHRYFTVEAIVNGVTFRESFKF